LILREEHGLRVVDNRVLGRIFGQKGGEVMGSWRRLRTQEFHNMYSLPGIIIMTRSRRVGLGRT
jgi:hypothetical protein